MSIYRWEQAHEYFGPELDAFKSALFDGTAIRIRSETVELWLKILRVETFFNDRHVTGIEFLGSDFDGNKHDGQARFEGDRTKVKLLPHARDRRSRSIPVTRVGG